MSIERLQRMTRNVPKKWPSIKVIIADLLWEIHHAENAIPGGIDREAFSLELTETTANAVQYRLSRVLTTIAVLCERLGLQTSTVLKQAMDDTAGAVVLSHDIDDDADERAAFGRSDKQDFVEAALAYAASEAELRVRLSDPEFSDSDFHQMEMRSIEAYERMLEAYLESE